MTTARDLITRSLRLIQVFSQGEALPSADAADGLEALNDLLGSWSNEANLAFHEKDDSLTLTGATSYTVGSGGDLDTTRPLRITGAYVRQNGNDYALTIVGNRWWDRVTDKDATGRPEYLYYEAEFPLGVVNLWPVGDSSYTLFFSSWKQLPSFTNLSDTVSLPPGYERAIAYNLALELAPEYERDPRPAVVEIARQAKRNIKSTNLRPPAMVVDTEIRDANGQNYSIYSDT